MEKEKYIAPEITYVEFNFKDRITLSGCVLARYDVQAAQTEEAEYPASTMICRDSW